ncbi:MAG: DUF2726 domain-containing protein [Chloroflexota bacterium]
MNQQKTDDAVNFIDDLLAGDDTSATASSREPEFPYHVRDHFLSPAELSFYQVLRKAITGRAVLNTKVALGDVFWVKSPDDPSKFRIYTNKIDRKHVDFLLCDPATMQPLIGIELDDKSHQRADRQERDAFVDQVFAAAKLPLLHIPAKRGYVVEELAAQLAPYLSAAPVQPPAAAPSVAQSITVDPAPSQAAVAAHVASIKRIAPVTTKPPPSPTAKPEAPSCPKCGSEMILRTVKNGANAGNHFWGCSTYPKCQGKVAYQG